MKKNDNLNADNNDQSNQGAGNDAEAVNGFDSEILNILKNAQDLSSPQLDLSFPEYNESEREQDTIFIPADVQDPDRAWILYYKKLQPLLKKYVKDPEAKKLIREQANLFLREGHTHGRDGRQAYYHQLETIIILLENWVQATQGKDLVGLYAELLESNQKAGYLRGK